MRETQFGSRGAGKPRTFPLKRLSSQPRRREVRVCFWQLRFKRGKGGPGAATGASGPLGRSEPGPRSGRVRPRALPPGLGSSLSAPRGASPGADGGRFDPTDLNSPSYYFSPSSCDFLPPPEINFRQAFVPWLTFKAVPPRAH